MSVVKSWIDKVLFTSAVVSNVTDVADSFRFVDLESRALTKTRGHAGDKIQVSASTFAMRTYTPVNWDVERGSTRLCAFIHGAGPGAHWVRSLRAGDTCSFFGPRGSLSFAKMSGDVVLFGDETSLGVGASLRALRDRSSHLVFEAAAERPTRTVVDALGLTDVAVVERKSDDAHLRGVSEHIAKVASSKDTTIVLTGRAASIVTLRRYLREAELPAAIKAKAYWAEGKKGLD